MGIFDILGVVLAGYVALAIVQGRVWAKRGPGAQLIVRDERPAYFWSVMSIYALLAILLMTWF